jgi:hypothetical protein
MTEVVYKPTSPYNSDLNTPITKTSLITGIILQGKRICAESVINGNGTQTIYTVPDGKSFFLFNINHNSYMSDNNLAECIISLNGNTEQLTEHFVSSLQRQEVVNIVYNNPIKYNISDYFLIQVITGAVNIKSVVTLIGYEVDNILLPTFI